MVVTVLRGKVQTLKSLINVLESDPAFRHPGGFGNTGLHLHLACTLRKLGDGIVVFVKTDKAAYLLFDTSCIPAHFLLLPVALPCYHKPSLV